MTPFNIVPLTPSVAAGIYGLQLRDPLTPQTAATLRRALHQHAVLLFRDQDLTEADQVRTSRAFGQPVRHPTSTLPPGPIPEITTISNLEENGQPIGALGNDEVRYHTDLCFLHQPGSFSTLYALETPLSGGETTWVGLEAAYSALDEAWKARVADLKVIYIHARPEYNPTRPPAHPLVSTHPDTGRKNLYFSPNHAHHIEGMDEEESRTLLAELEAHVRQERFAWTHYWKTGDIVVWDNRCTMHCRAPFPAAERRLMKRTQGTGRVSF
jgi:taurine dioxygenase